MGYIGEHLLPGQLGHFFIVLSLVASLVATFSFFMATKEAGTPVPANGTLLAGFRDPASWKKLARFAFITEVISVLAIFGILFYIIHNHLFEYKYAWQHSSRSLEFKYMLACFWEGQEGSFLLWSIWHCLLGLILIKTSKKWEAPVMTVVSFAQFCLATMIAGIYIFGWKMGSNPFILLRDSGVLDSAPALHIDFDITQALRPDYMLSIKDGNDLNPLLQNYWMVIHPPVLFMGFASTIVPFAFVIAGLWKKQFGEWTKPALPWALFSAAVLGVGIMMGARWAYESLTFGGYWAWDPVENASLVPWLVIISGIHTLLIYKHSGHSLRATHVFFIISFGLVLYSTFLTRSGILGDSSVHAFTDLGMNFQLLAFLLVFVVPSLIFFISRYRQIPTMKKEESGTSREFWMFIGSLIFFLSALVIITKTSLPVYNKIFGAKKAPPEDPEFSYNRIQVFVAMIIGLLTAIGQYLKYKETSAKYFWKKIWVPTLIAIIAASSVLAFGNINYTKKGPGFLGAIWLAVACTIYAIIANAGYIWLGIKGKLKLSGGSIAHVGFGMVLLGILITSSKKEVLSTNNTGIATPLGANEDPRENLTLIKGLPSDMGKYTLTYEKDSAHPKKQLWFYYIRFKSKDGKEEFVLKPNAFVNYKGNEGLMANPSAKHYWDHDVFTYITSLPNPEKQKDTAQFTRHSPDIGDSVFYSNGFMILKDIRTITEIPADIREILGPKGKFYEAEINIHSKTGSIYTIRSRMAYTKNDIISVPDTITAEGLIIRLANVKGTYNYSGEKDVERIVGGSEFDRLTGAGLEIKESDAIMKFVTLKAYKYPFINLLWFGVIITAIGIIISMVRRIQLNRNPPSRS